MENQLRLLEKSIDEENTLKRWLCAADEELMEQEFHIT